MARGKKTISESSANARAEALKGAIRDRAREVASTRSAKERLAEFADLSVSAIDQFLYEGKGSAATYINVFLYLFGLDEKTVLRNLQQCADIVRRQKNARKSDIAWFELDQDLTEDEKMYWISIIRHAIRLKKQ